MTLPASEYHLAIINNSSLCQRDLAKNDNKFQANSYAEGGKFKLSQSPPIMWRKLAQIPPVDNFYALIG